MPASGRALATPTQDMVLGSYYLTYSDLDFSKLVVEKMNPRPLRFRTEEVLARVEEGEAAGRIVAVRQGSLLATSFHPEMTGDGRVHELFVRIVKERQT